MTQYTQAQQYKLLPTRFNVESCLIKSDTLDGPKQSTGEFKVDVKAMIQNGIREWATCMLVLLRQELWLQGYMLSMEMMTVVMAKSCIWA